MLQKVSLYTIIYKLIKATNPLQIIIAIYILVTVIAKQFGQVRKHALSEIFSNAGGCTEVRPAVALDQLRLAVRIYHDVPPQDDEGVHAPFNFVMASHGRHADDGLDWQQEFLPLLGRKWGDDEVSELLIMQHALISSFRVVLLNCMVRQIDKFIVGIDVKFFGSQSDLEAVVNPGH